MITALKHAFQHYADFKTRTDRKTYWMFFLANFLIIAVLAVVSALSKGKDLEVVCAIVSGVFQLAVFIPSISIGVRRMHDINKSGWFFFIPILCIYWLAQVGQTSVNRFGNPQEIAKS